MVVIYLGSPRLITPRSIEQPGTRVASLMGMNRVILLSAFVATACLPRVSAQEARPATSVSASAGAPAPGATVTAPPAAGSRPGSNGAVIAFTPATAAAYYPPAGSSQAPLSASDVCGALRGGLSGPEVAQDVHERGFVGALSDDEAADARAAGAAPDFIAALQAGRFTVSPAYARRHAEAAAKNHRAVEANAWRAEASAHAQTEEREIERRRQGQIAAENNRAIAAKERDDKQRFENMKAQADWEQRQRDAYNSNDGYYYNGVWYKHRAGSRGHYRYY